ncbi:MAG: phosphatidylserine decarboxylase, partial [Oscillospiraceae bacterium]
MSNNQNKVLRFLYGTYCGRIILKPLITKPVSQFVGKILSLPVSKIMIKRFIIKNNIDMNDYIVKEYSSFNDFFTRDIKQDKRPFDINPNHLASLCDAKVLSYKINKNNRFAIKNSQYTIGELLENDVLAEKYNDGCCLIFRLEATDYHHYCYFDGGKQDENVYIKGQFHTVQPIAIDTMPIFKRNSRCYCTLETENFGDVV